MSVKLADFGLAIESREANDCQTFCGTPNYMAPEIFWKTHLLNEAKAGYGRQADMWSLGVVIYVTLSGEPPFDDREPLPEQILGGKYAFDGDPWLRLHVQAQHLVSGLMCLRQELRLSARQMCEHPWILGIE